MSEIIELVLNGGFGGFGLSHKGIVRYCELKGIPLYIEERTFGEDDESFVRTSYYLESPSEDKNAYRETFSVYDIDRSDSALAQTVKELGDEVDDDFSRLYIHELAIGTHYRIREYDGIESIECRDDIIWEIAGEI